MHHRVTKSLFTRNPFLRSQLWNTETDIVNNTKDCQSVFAATPNDCPCRDSCPNANEACVMHNGAYIGNSTHDRWSNCSLHYVQHTFFPTEAAKASSCIAHPPVKCPTWPLYKHPLSSQMAIEACYAENDTLHVYTIELDDDVDPSSVQQAILAGPPTFFLTDISGANVSILLDTDYAPLPGSETQFLSVIVIATANVGTCPSAYDSITLTVYMTCPVPGE